MIKALRNLKAERNVPKEARIEPILVARGTRRQSLAQGEAFLKSLLPASSVTIAIRGRAAGRLCRGGAARGRGHLAARGADRPRGRACQAAQGAGRLRASDRLAQVKLGNESYVARAPAEVVAQTRAKLVELESQRAAVSSLLRAGLNRC